MHAYIMPQRPETLDPLLYAAWVLVRAGRPPEGISQNSVSLSGSPWPSLAPASAEPQAERVRVSWRPHLAITSTVLYLSHHMINSHPTD